MKRRYNAVCLLAVLMCLSACAPPERADAPVSDGQPAGQPVEEGVEPTESTETDGAGPAAEPIDIPDRGPRVVSVVAYRKIEVVGGLDVGLVRRLLKMHRREVSFCHERQLDGDSELEGEVDIRFSIDASGEVGAAMIERSTLENRAVEDCLTKRIPRWVFPEPTEDGAVEVLFPITFAVQVD